MNKILNTIIEQYHDNRNKPFRSNGLAEYIRAIPKSIIAELNNIDFKQYKIEGSSGKGNWAAIPWIGFFDVDLTKTATEGYYIVYLFRADMSGVYLSLNQGWTYYQNKYGIRIGKKKIYDMSLLWKNKLPISIAKFPDEIIDLKAKDLYSYPTKVLSHGYELGHICGKFYERGNIPDNDVLQNDLFELIQVYKNLKKQLSESLNDIYVSENALSSRLLERSLQKSVSGKLLLEKTLYKNDRRYKKLMLSKTDYIAKAISDRKLGIIGEKLVMEYEQKNLVQSGRSDLAEKIEHISETQGDCAGYDILSFTPNGEYKYIEVKTSGRSEQDNFFLSRNEYNFAKKHKKNFYIYRVYALKKRAGKLFIYDYKEFSGLIMVPDQYLVRFN